MSERDRIDDAVLLWKHARREGAFISILIAAAATARKRYPKPKRGEKVAKGRPRAGEPASDNVAFKSFMLDEMDKITGGPKYNVVVPFQGKDTPLEDILYTYLRCELLHEGKTPPSIRFTDPVIKDGKSYSVLELKDPIGIPINFLWNLARAVAQAKENRPLFKDYTINNPPMA
jgi:hypothetical protein